MAESAGSFAAVPLDETAEESDVLEHTGVCAAVEAVWLFEINCAGLLENRAVLFACWLLLHHYHGL